MASTPPPMRLASTPPPMRRRCDARAVDGCDGRDVDATPNTFNALDEDYIERLIDEQRYQDAIDASKVDHETIKGYARQQLETLTAGMGDAAVREPSPIRAEPSLYSQFEAMRIAEHQDDDCTHTTIKPMMRSYLTSVPSPTSGLVRIEDDADGGAIVVVDPMSTGANLAFDAASARGLPVICCWSDVCPFDLRVFVDHRLAVRFAGEVVHRTGALDTTIAELCSLGLPIRAIVVGSEPGVELADELASALGLRGNGTALSATRRNKFYQAQAIGAAGLAVGAQAVASCAAQMEAFLASQAWPTPFKAVVKPVDGAASQGVTVCDSPGAVRAAFGALCGATNVFGRANADSGVLLMEYLGGDEYVVDTVSRGGVHKCVAVWRYIKGRLNGADNVYYGMRLLHVHAGGDSVTGATRGAEDKVAAPSGADFADPDDGRNGDVSGEVIDEVEAAMVPRMVQYVFGVLDALGIANGAVHSECKHDGATAAGRARGAVLIESNCRLHGAEGSWRPIADACLGYSHVSALLDAYTDGAAFAALPRTPSALRAHGAQVGVRSVVAGTLARVDADALGAIRGVASYVGECLPASLAVGQRIDKTIDIVTLVGQVNLVHADAAQLEADLATVQAIIDRGLFEVYAE